jgi:hypothetical protein
VGNGSTKTSCKEVVLEARNFLTSGATLNILKGPSPMEIIIIIIGTIIVIIIIVPVRSDIYCVLILARTIESS